MHITAIIMSILKMCKSVLSLILLCSILELNASESLFHIECPPDVTVGCEEELWDLSIYGNAYVFGYGNPVPADPPYVHYNLNSCNVGHIIRTWSAADYGGNIYTCSQVITVVGSVNATNIDWPDDLLDASCTDALEPSDLSYPYNKPVVTSSGDCTQIAVGYTDQVFTIVPGACQKILRTWTVLDWCEYDPNNPYSGGSYTNVQVIKVLSNDPPVITCGSDITVSSAADCSSSLTQVPVPIAEGVCSSDLTITNDSPYALGNGADASGYYPTGTTIITFRVEDGCGNFATCTSSVTVVDSVKPTPYCYHGIAVPLSLMSDGYYLNLTGNMFDAGSYDNCTPQDKLIITVNPPVVTCENLGTVDVTVTVTDESGNSNFCVTYVNVQDNMDMCPPMPSPLSGTISNPDGIMVEGASVSLVDQSTSDMTDENGAYYFADLEAGEKYMIMSEKTGPWLEGVSTRDFVQLVKHLYNIEAITDPANLVAADIDKNGLIDEVDLQLLRQMLLSNDFQLASNTSWRIIENSILQDPEFDIASNVDGSFEIVALDAGGEEIDFTAIKIGDINHSFNPNPLEILLEDRSLTTIEYSAEYQGELVFVSLSNSDEITAMQLALSYQQEDFSLVSMTAIKGQLFQDDFNQNSLMWYSENEVQDEVLQLLFKRKNNKSSVLNLSLDSEQVNNALNDSEEFNVQLLERIKDQKLTLYQNSPNPVSDQTMISFYNPVAQEIVFELIDLSGKKIISTSDYYDAGIQQISLNRAEIFGHGMFLYSIKSPTDKQTKKLTIVNP